MYVQRTRQVGMRVIAIRYENNVKRAETIEKFNFFNHGIRIKMKRQTKNCAHIHETHRQKKLYFWSHFNRFGARVRNVQ